MKNSFQEILSVDPMDLLAWLTQNFSYDIPLKIETSEDLMQANKVMGKITEDVNYLNNLYLFAKIKVRMAKREKMSKEEVEDWMDRRDILDNYKKSVQFQYTSISRMITVKQQLDYELKMLGNIT